MFKPLSLSQSLFVVSLGLLLCLGQACKNPDAPAEEPATEHEVVPASHSSEENAEAHDHDDHDHDHDGEETIPEPSTGPLDVALGEEIDEELPLVTVEELLAKAEEYEGEVVRVEGAVTDMCHHQRGWFGVAAEGAEQVVRVAVAPRFLAPEDALGSRAVAQGKVEIRTIPAADIEHYRSAHKFLPLGAGESGEDVKLPTIAGTGATFNR